MTSSLRPLEWYNLAVRYGPDRGLLHDDLYDQDGTAEQPTLDVRDAHFFPAPTLEEVRADVGCLADFVLTRPSSDTKVQAELAVHEPREVLEALDRRIHGALRSDIREMALEICATALGDRAEGWVRAQWEAKTPLSASLARASARCLPGDEGFDRVAAALDAIPPKHRPASHLRHFRSERTLDWIERSVQRPVTDDWGWLAAQSCLSWERAARWLDLGRPLSLVALDALFHCITRYTPFVHEQPPELSGPAPVDEMIERLKAYAQTDPAHRPTQTVAAILAHLEGPDYAASRGNEPQTAA
jgi:hypothetical protein